MIKSFFAIGWRNLKNNKAVSILNIGGLAVGMAVAILIGLWIWDELSFDRHNKNYDSIAQLARKEMSNGEVFIADNSNHFPIPLAAELRTSYASSFKHVALATEPVEQLLTADNNKFAQNGMYIEPAFTNIFTLQMLAGTSKDFTAPNSILISSSLSVALFGHTAPVGKVLQLNNAERVIVTGVFADFPFNSRFSGIDFFCPWNLLVATNTNVKRDLANWSISSYHIFVQTAPGLNMAAISHHIKDVYWPKIKTTRASSTDEPTTLFLHPMKDWHLRSEWKNGAHAGGQIQVLWLFGIIGVFVLLLACINFMNLSTARSEKRAREVGIRKTFGSPRWQLVKQFMGESLLLVCVAFLVSIGLALLSLRGFNELAGKKISFPVSSPAFWIVSLLFIFVTAFVSGSYPALYLSSFRPAKVLKGTFRAGRWAAMPRRVLTGLQFTVSIILIIGTMVVYRQIQHGYDRPIGYERKGLIRVNMTTADLNNKYDVLQKELLGSGGAIGFAQSTAATTENNFFDDRFEWETKDASMHPQSFVLTAVTWDFGKTVGWQFVKGRDFSRSFKSDSAAIILNKTAVNYMHLPDPVGTKVKWQGKSFTVVGVIEDMVTASPYKPVQQSVFFMIPQIGPVITIRLNPHLSASEAIGRIQPVFRKLNPSAPFEYTFVDDEYGRKFAAEQRIGALSGFFASLAIFISCLGILGLASFVAQQRTREMGVRKVLGASVATLWGLLIREFVLLVSIAYMIAVPVSNYFMNAWLQHYEYRTDLSWWIFAAAGLGAIVITILTASLHALKTARANPVRSLRTE